MCTSKFSAQAIEDLISNYHELNPVVIDELDEEPSPLDFMRFVARNRPFVVRKGAQDWPACQKWGPKYLTKVMGDQMVNVAITPHGNADSVMELENGSTIFVKPYEIEMEFEQALNQISRQGLDPANQDPVWYCQTQNDNLRNEYELLFADVPKSVPFARIALQKDPDAINFWLGNARSVTALHKDPYENIYVQLLGQKHFVLLPPVESTCINEQKHSAATYQPRMADSNIHILRHSDLHAVLDEPRVTVPFAIWDPDLPTKNTTPFSHLSKPLRVSLNPGDILYLPALWYHKVSQSCSSEGISCAVNYWYDMDYTGSFYSLSTFARKVGLGVNGVDID